MRSVKSPSAAGTGSKSRNGQRLVAFEKDVAARQAYQLTGILSDGHFHGSSFYGLAVFGPY